MRIFILSLLIFAMIDFNDICAQCPGYSVINVTVSDVVCKGQDNGMVSIIVFDSTGSNSFIAFLDEGAPPNGIMESVMINGQNVFVDTIYNIVPGTYYLKIGDANFCTDTIAITVNEPQNQFVIEFDSIKHPSNGNNGFLSALTTGGWSSPSVFVWDAYDVNGIQYPAFPRTLGFQMTTLLEGFYIVYSTDLKGCTDSVSINLINDVTSVTNSNFKDLFSIYPNPASNILNLNFEKLEIENTRFKIIDLNGKINLDGNIESTQGQQLDIDFLEKGLYYFTLYNNAEIYSIPFEKN